MRIEPAANSVRRPAFQNVAHAASETARSTAASGKSITSVDTQSIDAVLKLTTDASAIRELVVNDIKSQIQSGEYLAKQDAFKTASSILNL